MQYYVLMLRFFLIFVIRVVFVGPSKQKVKDFWQETRYLAAITLYELIDISILKFKLKFSANYK